MAPSNPDFRFPPCPTCTAQVCATTLDEGGEYTTADGGTAWARASYAARDPLYTERVAGAPELDCLVLHPCGHLLTGHDVWTYNLAAAQLTYPQVRIEIRLTVPAALTDTDAPRLVTLAHGIDPDDLLAEAATTPGDPLLRRLRSLAVQAEHLIPDVRALTAAHQAVTG